MFKHVRIYLRDYKDNTIIEINFLVRSIMYVDSDYADINICINIITRLKILIGLYFSFYSNL